MGTSADDSHYASVPFEIYHKGMIHLRLAGLTHGGCLGANHWRSGAGEAVAEAADRRCGCCRSSERCGHVDRLGARHACGQPKAGHHSARWWLVKACRHETLCQLLVDALWDLTLYHGAKKSNTSAEAPEACMYGSMSVILLPYVVLPTIFSTDDNILGCLTETAA